jgi:rhodanese-related sulfurtransferase
MEPSQIVFLAVGLLSVVLYLRRYWQTRSIKQYTPREIVDAKKRGDVILLDVRTDRERSSSSIRGSLHIPLHQLSRRLEELQKHRHREIVCYCQSGSRSVSAAVTLQKHGFTVGNLKGGIAEWNFQNVG